MKKINLKDKLSLIDDHWHQRIIAEANGMHVKLSKLEGPFVWHRHDDADELFWILSGRLLMQFRDREVWLEAGELIVVPKGVEHLPVAAGEVALVVIEPAGTLNTGNLTNEYTREELEWI